MKKPQKQFVLIHGLSREARHWGDFPEFLRQQFPLAAIHTPDIPGNGLLHQMSSPKTIAGMTEKIRQQITFRNNLNLIAISMGAMIAIDCMSRYVSEINTAVLINTSARPVAPLYHRLRWQIYPAILKMLFLSKSRREQEILALTSNRHGQDNQLLNNWLQWQQHYPVSAVNALNQLIAAARFTLPSKPPQPMLIVTSTADRLVNNSCSLNLQQTWQTAYRQHEQAGHDLALDDPEWLATQIGQWQCSLSD